MAANQEGTPLSSGRSSPAIILLSRQQALDGSLKSDKAYRRYASTVERSLVPFVGNQNEWADYISFLGRLLKALQTRPAHIHAIPHCEMVAFRLSQCMDPSLPSGVHQKTLEVYEYIFQSIGPANVARNLQLYLPGLVATFTFASLTVRPLFLDLFEKYILPTGHGALRPAMKALILCLLPGLEDETSEDFERVLRTVDGLRKSMRDAEDISEGEDPSSKDSFFWHSFFLAVISNASRRLGGLAYLSRFFPSLASTQNDQFPLAAQAVIYPEPGLVIRCFVAGLSDSNVLVQRGFLDLIATRVPLSSHVLQKITLPADLEMLVTAAAGVVLRRDMSLNRRLWVWLLGLDGGTAVPPQQVTSPASNNHAQYFLQYGKTPLCNGIMKMIQSQSDLVSERSKPFRISISLMDRWEVGSLLVPQLFLPALESVLQFQRRTVKVKADEVIKSANLFFDGVESNLIWGTLFTLMASALGSAELSTEQRLDKLNLYTFIITSFTINDEAMLMHHIPLALLSIFLRLERGLSDQSSPIFDEEIVQSVLSIVEILLKLIAPRLFDDGKQEDASLVNKYLTTPSTSLLAEIAAHYQQGSQTTDQPIPILNAPVLGSLLLQNATARVRDSMTDFSDPIIDKSTRILVTLLYKLPSSLVERERTQMVEFLIATIAKELSHGYPSFTLIKSAVDIFATFSFNSTANTSSNPSELMRFIGPTISTLWHYLAPDSPRHHVEAVRCIWQLDSTNPTSRCVEAGISHILTHTKPNKILNTISTDSARRFAVLWTHGLQKVGRKKKPFVTRKGETPSDPSFPDNDMFASFSAVVTRPLLLLLESLDQPDSDLAVFVTSWIRDLTTLSTLFSILLSPVWQSAFGHPAEDTAMADKAKELTYYVRHIRNVLAIASDYNWSIISQNWNISAPSPGGLDSLETTLQHDITVVSLELFRRNSTDPEVSILRHHCLLILQLVFQNKYSSLLTRMEVERTLLSILKSFIPSLPLLVQTTLLQTVVTVLKAQPEEPSTIIQTDRLPIPKGRTSRDTTQTLIVGSQSQPEVPILDVSIPHLESAIVEDITDCLKLGFTTRGCQSILDRWTSFLNEVLPIMSGSILQHAVSLVETICRQMSLTLSALQAEFKSSGVSGSADDPENCLIWFMNSLESILSSSHHRLLMEETVTAAAKTPDQNQGFFGNVVGVFGSDHHHHRSMIGNSRLGVLLCFKDVVKVCYSIWAWGDSIGQKNYYDSSTALSFQHTSFRVRNRARRLLEHAFGLESLECLEALAAIWCEEFNKNSPSVVLNLLNVLNGSKPKLTIPSIFNAIYSRTNQSALDRSRLSSRTSNLSEVDLTAFLVQYTLSIEDDAVDEIWGDCVVFLKDILATPMPHRFILPGLLQFTATLAKKMDNTAFGDQKKIRRELIDIVMRVLTAMFTTRPIGNYLESDVNGGDLGDNTSRVAASVNVLPVLHSVVSNFQAVLIDDDKINTAVGTICSSVLAPIVHSKHYPDNLSTGILKLMAEISSLEMASRTWKRDVSDALSDSRILQVKPEFLKPYFLPITAQFCSSERTVISDILSKIAPPTTSGIVFGVGAASARLEADRRTQLLLRRIVLCFLASPNDTFSSDVPLVAEKVSELVTANATTAPSAAIRADIFLLLRAIVVKVSAQYLAPLWPVANEEIYQAILSLLPGHGGVRGGGSTGANLALNANPPPSSIYSNNTASNSSSDLVAQYDFQAIIQACKLLDVLLLLAPDDFQLHQWIFVTDTIDAIYRPDGWTPTSVVDQVSDKLSRLDINLLGGTGMSGGGGGGTSGGGFGGAVNGPPRYNPSPSSAIVVRNGIRYRRPFLDALQTQGFGEARSCSTVSTRSSPSAGPESDGGTEMAKSGGKSGIGGSGGWSKPEIIASVVRPMLRHLSSTSYEMVFEMVEPDLSACVDSLLEDVFQDVITG